MRTIIGKSVWCSNWYGELVIYKRKERAFWSDPSYFFFYLGIALLIFHLAIHSIQVFSIAYLMYHILFLSYRYFLYCFFFSSFLSLIRFSLFHFELIDMSFNNDDITEFYFFFFYMKAGSNGWVIGVQTVIIWYREFILCRWNVLIISSIHIYMYISYTECTEYTEFCKLFKRLSIFQCIIW